MPLATFLKSPLTDLTGPLCTHQTFGKCATLEEKMMNCYEAYGLDRAQLKCADIFEDFKECVFKTKQYARVREMRSERYRQYHNNERTKEELFAPGPRVDVY